MFISRTLNQAVWLWLSVVVLVSIFLFSDVLLTPIESFFDAASVVNRRMMSVASLQGGKPQVTLGNMAQAQAASTSTKAPQEEINLFRMMMGALAGLVLFIYGSSPVCWTSRLSYVLRLHRSR
jgi:phosphate:Na+ symporter